ncbi:MAG TPA: CAP domain-containing protein [Bacteroidales bacterium]
MLRKTWKTLKYFLIIAILLVCLPHSLLPVQKEVIDKNDFSNYVKLNDSERRLIEFKDDDEALKLKLIQLDLINKSRKRYNATPVKLDILASRVANKMCQNAAENSFIGHWNTAGENPYQRYAFAGGYDHVSENAFGEWSSDNYDVSNSNISSMMNSGHEKFMAERSPNDGHKKTIIDKPHNFVGIGYYLSGKQFRYYEEFIDRYLEFENIPSELKVDEPGSITVKTNDNNFLYFLIIYYEKFPQPLLPAQISKKGSYADFTDDEFKNITAWDLSRYRNGTTYKIPVKFPKDGLYYIQIYQDMKEMTKAGSLNTKGKTPVSGIVIKVVK